MDTEETAGRPSDARRPGAYALGLLGLALVFLGFGGYVALIDDPWIRTWGIPNALILLLGTGIAWYATTRRPFWAGLTLAILCTLMTGFFLAGLYLMGSPAVPGPGRDLSLASLPQTLLDENGQPVSLAELAGKGPVLLVFYRGHW